MKRRPRNHTGAALFLALSASACASNGGTADGSGGRPGGNNFDAGPDSGGTGGLTGSGGGTVVGTGGRNGTGGAPALGLTQRPVNTTCRPPAMVDQPAAKLSQTGCADPADPRKPAAGLIPYGVNSPLWSDGAEKERFIGLPEGGTIQIKNCASNPDSCRPLAAGGTLLEEGDMEVPDGTVLVKTFAFGTKLVETRLLVRYDRDNWFGYSYEWNDAGTDADVLPDTMDGKDKVITGFNGQQQTWHFPSRTECLRCHTDGAGVSLGLEVGQMNGDYRYPVSGRTSNQLTTLAAIGVFSGPLPATPASMPALPDPASTTASVDVRARSYMHANCAICHRPNGNFANIDLRFATPMAQRNLCNIDNEKGTLGVTGAKRLVPGMKGLSTTWLRMDSLDRGPRMPQIGSLVKDVPGTDLVGAWITGLTGCQ